MFRTGQARPIQSPFEGTPYGRSPRPIAPTGPRAPRQPPAPQPTAPYPNYPRPPRDPNDREGIAAWTGFYGTAPVFQRLPTPRPAPYGWSPRPPRTFITTSPGAGPGRGDTRPRQSETTWGDITSGAWATTSDDAEYFVGSAADSEAEAWNAQQAQQAQQQHDELIRRQNQFNQMQQANRAPPPPQTVRRIQAIRRR